MSFFLFLHGSLSLSPPCPPIFFLFHLPQARKRQCREQGERGYEKGSFSLQDLRRPSIGERANERGASRSFPSPNRWKIDGDENVPRIYFTIRPSVCPFVRFFLSLAMEGRSRARARLIFKVPDERNDRGLTFRARARFHEKRDY